VRWGAERRREELGAAEVLQARLAIDARAVAEPRVAVSESVAARG
jgi:hypothetical protein